MTDWLGTLGGIVVVVVFFGAAVVYIRGSKDKGTITTLERNNAALTARVTLLEASELHIKAEAEARATLDAAKIDALNVRVKALEDDNAALRSQRPSAEAIEAVYALCQAIHSDTSKILKRGAGP